MTTLPRCSCCAYTATKELVEKRFDEYESLQSRFKAAERQLEKLDTQISAIRADIARKAQTALKSELKEGRGNLLVLLDDFHVAVNEYEEIEADMGCPCCRGVPGAKGSYNDMIEAADVLRESFVDSTGSALVPHAALQIRRDDYADKADRACELKQVVIRRMLAFADFFRDFLAEFQGLQSRFNQMMEGISMHNALLLLGEEFSTEERQKDQKARKEAKKGRSNAAKSGNKGKKAAAALKKPAEHSHAAVAKAEVSAGAPAAESEEEASDEDDAVRAAVAHSNPFAALNNAEEGSEAPVEGEDSYLSSGHSTASEAHLGTLDDISVDSDSHEDDRGALGHAEPDLAAQRGAILARLRDSDAGAAELSGGAQSTGQEAGRQAGSEQLCSARQLKAKLGGSLIATQLVHHLCCPITGELMQDAVVAMDGHTYEREAILEWFEERPAGFSFLTKKKLSSKSLLPNKEYRSLVVQLAA